MWLTRLDTRHVWPRSIGTIAVAVAEASGEVRSLGVIPNRPEPVRRLVRKLGPAQSLREAFC